jgi:putative heme-binding domain-containing protein
MKPKLIPCSLLCFLTIAAGALTAADGSNGQIDRGRLSFLNSTKSQACATCHSLEGKGASVGPDLTRLAAAVGPRGLAMTILMTMTAYVQEVSLKDGRRFPGIQKAKEGDTVLVFDLSKKPPELLTLQAADISSMKENTKWTHPPTTAGYTPDELADIIAYLKFAATGTTKEVSVTELK